jgi:hypothetical protein
MFWVFFGVGVSAWYSSCVILTAPPSGSIHRNALEIAESAVVIASAAAGHPRK